MDKRARTKIKKPLPALQSLKLGRTTLALALVEVIYYSITSALWFSGLITPAALGTGVMGTLSYLVTDVVFVVNVIWLFRLHKDLGAMYSSYPLTPWRAIIPYFIPIVNVWGVWRIFTTIARYFGQSVDATRAQSLRLWAILSLPAGLVSWMLICYVGYMSVTNPPALLASIPLWVGYSVLGILSNVIWLLMVWYTVQVIHIIAAQTGNGSTKASVTVAAK